MKSMLDKYPIGTRLKVKYEDKVFMGTVAILEAVDYKSGLDIIPDIVLNHHRYVRYGVHFVDKNGIIDAMPINVFADDLFIVE